MSSRERLKNYKRFVVKVGTSSLTHPNGKLNLQAIERLSWVLTNLENSGKEMILVSSGAVAVGSDTLGLPERPRDVKGKQAAAAVGQGVLMHIYHNFFMTYNQKVAQILITKDVFEDETRRLNAKNTFYSLLSMNVIPIVNENDTVSTEELGFSENDMLSAYVAGIVEADALIILSDIDGLYTEDPRKNPNAEVIHEISSITKEIEEMAGSAGSKFSTGGMAAKISAAKSAVEQGIDTIIAQGADSAILNKILNGENVGTLFSAK